MYENIIRTCEVLSRPSSYHLSGQNFVDVSRFEKHMNLLYVTITEINLILIVNRDAMSIHNRESFELNEFFNGIFPNQITKPSILSCTD